MGKISVIIPTHNRADLLPRAIKSVQDQTRAVDEIIVVSDGSTDNTEETVKKMGYVPQGSYQVMADKPAYTDAYKLAEQLMNEFAAGGAESGS